MHWLRSDLIGRRSSGQTPPPPSFFTQNFVLNKFKVGWARLGWPTPVPSSLATQLHGGVECWVCALRVGAPICNGALFVLGFHRVGLLGPCPKDQPTSIT